MKRALLIGGPVVALVVVVLFLSRRPDGPCAIGPKRVEAAWSPARRERLLTVITQQVSGKYADQTARRVDTRARAIGEGWADVCRKDDPASATARRCLEGRLQQLEGVASAIIEPATSVTAIFNLVGRLDEVRPCLEGEPVSMTPWPGDDASLAAIRDVRRQLFGAEALRLSAKPKEARAMLEKSLNLAIETRWKPLVAEASFTIAQVLELEGKTEEAAALMRDAAALAESEHHDELLVRVAAHHLTVAGSRASPAADAELWVKRLEEAVSRLPRPGLRAEADVALTVLRVAQGQLSEGDPVSARAAEWAKANDPETLADVRALRTQLFLQHGQVQSALAEARQAAGLRADLLGPKHPLALHALVSLGESQTRAGLADDGRTTLTTALDELRRSKTANPLIAAQAVLALSLAQELTGEVVESVKTAQDAHRLFVELLGKEHRASALALRSVGERQRTVGKPREAVSSLTEAMDLSSAALGPKHRETLEARAHRALTLATYDLPDARAEATGVVAACASDANIGEGPLVPARLAVAFLRDSTVEERAAALETARRVRGERHPDVLKARLLQLRAKDPGVTVAEVIKEAQALNLPELPFRPLTFPQP